FAKVAHWAQQFTCASGSTSASAETSLPVHPRPRGFRTETPWGRAAEATRWNRSGRHPYTLEAEMSIGDRLPSQWKLGGNALARNSKGLYHPHCRISCAGGWLATRLGTARIRHPECQAAQPRPRLRRGDRVGRTSYVRAERVKRLRGHLCRSNH